MDHNVRSIPVTITTRGIGIAIANIEKESVLQWNFQYMSDDSSDDDEYFRKRSDHHPSIYAMYRAGLGLLETKIASVPLPIFTTNFKDEDVNNDLFNEQFVYVYKVPTPIARIIDAIGVVRCGDKMYHPVVAAPAYEDGKLIPRSENVLLSTLRETVEALADAETPALHRTRFRETCPIPGAVWNDDDILTNPDEIIPQHYTEFSNDLHKLNLSSLYFRNSYLSGKHLNTSFIGKKSLLLSCKLTDIRMNQEKACSYTDTRGCDISSPEPLCYQEQVEGLLNLLGEVPKFDQNTIYHPRYEINHTYTGYVSSSISNLEFLIQNNHLSDREMLLWSIPLTITSRGIGFNVAQLMREFYINPQRWRMDDVPQDFIYKLYRVSLGALECRLQAIHPEIFSADYSNDDVYDIPYYTKNELGFLPKSIMNIINAIGVVRCGDRAYHPVVAAPAYEDGKLIPRSENVLLSTLRETVEALADAETPALHRTRFRETCPIPGAVWNDDDILTNPDEIIPQHYTYRDYSSHFQKDLYDLRKYNNFWNNDTSMAKINMDSKTGDTSMLLSNVLLEMRVSARRHGEEVDAYGKRCRVEGNMSECFTSPNRLNGTQLVNGLFHLLGEVPPDYRTCYRRVYVSREQISHSYGVHRNTCYYNLFKNWNRLERMNSKMASAEAEIGDGRGARRGRGASRRRHRRNRGRQNN